MVGSSPDKAVSRQHCQMAWARRAFRRGIREKPVLLPVLTYNRLEPDGSGAGAVSCLLGGTSGQPARGPSNDSWAGPAANDYGVAAGEAAGR